MPVYDPQKRLELRDAGYNPDEFDELIEAPDTPAPTQQNPAPTSQKTSAPGALLRSAGRALPSAGVGILGGVGGAKLGAGIGTAILPGAGTVAGGLLGGIGGGIASAIAARKAQDAVAERVIPGYAESQATDVAEHPVASAVGEVAGGLPFLAPSLRSFPGALRAIANPLRGNTVAAADVGNLANVGLGAAIPLGQQIATDPNVKLSEPSSIIEAIRQRPMEYAINTIGGALLNSPTKIGQRLGLTPNTYRQFPISPDNARTLQTAGTEAKVIDPKLLPERTGPIVTPPPEPQYKDGPQPFNLTQTEEVLRQAPPNPNSETAQTQRQYEAEYLAAQQELQAERARIEAETAAAKAEVERLRAVRSEMLPATVEAQSGYDSGENYFKGGKPEVTIPTEEIDTRPLPRKDTYAPGDSYYKNRYSEEGIQDQTTTRQAPLVRGLTEANIPSKPTAETLEAYKQLGAERNVNVTSDRPVYSAGSAEIAGSSTKRIGTESADVKINPRKAGLDTPAHEITHNLVDDLAELGSTKQKAFVNRARRIFQDSPEYATWQKEREAKNLNSSVDEYLTTLSGEDAVRRLYRTDKKGDIKNWFEDVRSNFRMKLNRAKPEDASRLMSAKLLYDAPFSENFGKAVTDVGATAGVRNQEEGLGKVDPQTETPEFKQWFGDSKVVDQSGKPLRVYHGTNKDIKTFDPTLAGTRDRGFYGVGMYFTPDSAYAGEYPKISYKNGNISDIPAQEGKNILPAYVSLKNPYIAQRPSELYNFVKTDNGTEITKRLKEWGYDGVITVDGGELREIVAFYPEQIKSATGNKGTFNSSNPDIRESESSPLREATSVLPRMDIKGDKTTESIPVARGITSSEIDNIYKIGTPQAKVVGDAFSGFYDRLSHYTGQLNNAFSNAARKVANLEGIVKPLSKSPKDYLRQNTAVMEATLKKMYDTWDGQKVTFTPEESKLRAEVQKILKTVRDLHRSKPGMGKAPDGDNPDYVPHITKYSVIRKIQEDGSSPEAMKLKEEFIDYQSKKMLKGKTDSEAVAKAKAKAEDNLNELLGGYTKKTVDIASTYGPIDRAEGFGLPESWRETNMLNMMDRYLSRISRRMAYFDSIQSNPKAMEALEAGALGGNENVRTVHDNIKGVQNIADAKLNSALGVVKASNMGPLTGARDFVANLTLGLQHHELGGVQTVKSIISALSDLKQNIADGYATGRIRNQMNDLEWNDMVGWLRRGRDVLSDAQGRNYLEKLTRGVAMGQGKMVTLDFHNKWANGKLSKQGQKWFKDFAKGVDYMKPSLTADEVNTIAARYVDSVQGTYDYRGLPKWSVEGQLSPIFALARWNIEKFNNFQKNVVAPAMEGNLVPLINSTLGIVVGGAAVAELTELVSGRKEKLPEWKELQAAQEMGEDVKLATAYKLAGLVSVSGHMGILGDVIKGVMDDTYGKVRPRWYDNMLIESAAGVSSTVTKLLTAAGEGELSVDTFAEAASMILEDNLQTYRLILNNLSNDTLPMGNKEDIERGNKMRDLRMFNLTRGGDVPDYTGSEYSEPLEDRELRQFKRTENMQEAAEMLPQLLTDAFEEAGNNPEKLRRELGKLKRNSFQTMPNPDTMPESFLKYVLYLKKTQGEEKANDRLRNYILQNAVNSAKSEMVP